MEMNPHSAPASFGRLVMLGAAPETRGSIAAVCEGYRGAGLFKRWPVEYLAARCDGPPARKAAAALRALRRFVGLLVRERRFVLHVHAAADARFWLDALFMGAALAARCPVVLQLHGGGFERFYDRAGGPGRALLRFFLERASCVIAPAEAVRAWVRSLSRHARVEVLPHPVAVPREGAPTARPNLVLFLGRLSAEKGVFDLLEAVAALRSAVPDVRLVCAGDGDREAVLRFAERLGIADAVKFTGWVGPSGKRALLETAAVFALPSYSEGMPAGLLEAMAAGVPVVAAPVGGVPEALVDGVSGFFAAPGDKATLTRLLRRLLLDKALAARIGAAARESVRLRFAPDRALARLEQVYADAGLSGAAVQVDARDPRMKEAA